MKHSLCGLVLAVALCGCSNPGGANSSTPLPPPPPAAGSMTPAPATPAASTATWKEFTAENGAFTAQFPAEVKVEKPEGAYNAKAETDPQHSFGIDWNQVAKTVPVDQKMMDGMTAEMEKHGGKVLAKEIVTLAGVPAAHMTVEAPDRKGEFWYAVAEKGLFTIEVSNDPKATPVSDADKKMFLDSIKFHEATGAAAAATPAPDATDAAEDQAAEDATESSTPAE